MSADSRILTIGAARLTMPEGCAAELFFTFTAPEERLTVSVYADSVDADPQAMAEDRLNFARNLAGQGMAVIRQQPGEVAGKASCATILQAKENDGSRSTLCQLLVRLSPRHYLDLKYQFSQRSTGSRDDFDRMVAELHLDGTARVTPTNSTGWTTRELPSLQLGLPSRLKRSTPYIFSDSAGKIKWSADAWVVGPSPEIPTETIQADPPAPGSMAREESFYANNIAGNITFRRTIDAETGKAGDQIVRGEVVVQRRVRVLVRGRGPDADGEKLDRDLRFVLQNLTLKED